MKQGMKRIPRDQFMIILLKLLSSGIKTTRFLCKATDRGNSQVHMTLDLLIYKELVTKEPFKENKSKLLKNELAQQSLGYKSTRTIYKITREGVVLLQTLISNED